MIEKELKKQGFTASQLFKPEWVDIILKNTLLPPLRPLGGHRLWRTYCKQGYFQASKRNTGKLSRPKNLRNRWPNLDDKKGKNSCQKSTGERCNR